MIERQIAFTLEPARAEAFERFITKRYLPAAAAIPGFVRFALAREADDPARYQLVLRWVDTDAAVAWRTSDAHRQLQPDLGELASIERIVQLDVIA